MDLNDTLANYIDNDVDNEIFLEVSYWERIIISILVGLISVVGIIGNTMIILAVAFSLTLQKSANLNIFVTYLSITDLFASISLIWFVVRLLGEYCWPLSTASRLCEFSASVVYGCIGVSMLNHGLIAIHRLMLHRLSCRRSLTGYKIDLHTYVVALVAVCVYPVGAVTFVIFVYATGNDPVAYMTITKGIRGQRSFLAYSH